MQDSEGLFYLGSAHDCTSEGFGASSTSLFVCPAGHFRSSISMLHYGGGWRCCMGTERREKVMTLLCGSTWKQSNVR